MRKLLLTLSSLFLCYFLLGLIINHYHFGVFSNQFEPEDLKNYYDYKGVLNVHTTKSTGTGTPEEVIQAASEAGLDYIYITDLNPFPPSTKNDSYYDHLLVMSGGEYSYLDSRILNINYTSEQHLQNSGDLQLILTSLLDQKHRNQGEGLLVLAHPLKPNYEWSGEYPAGLDGIEVINLKSIWQDSWLNQKLDFFWTIFIYPFNPEVSFVRLLNQSEKEFSLLDSLNLKNKTLAFAGTDAEARFNVFDSLIKFPSYQSLFNIVSNHVLLTSELTGNYEADRTRISNAISRGNFYLSYDIIANPKGFIALLQEKNKAAHLMGEEINWEKGMELKIQLPKGIIIPFNVQVYRDGKEISSSRKDSFSVPVDKKGVYRIVVELRLDFPLPDGHKWIPWIFSNPFFVR